MTLRGRQSNDGQIRVRTKVRTVKSNKLIDSVLTILFATKHPKVKEKKKNTLIRSAYYSITYKIRIATKYFFLSTGLLKFLLRHSST